MKTAKILDSFREIKDHQAFPYEAMEQAVAQKETITPYLLESLDYVYKNSGEIFENEDPYAVHLYAMYLLAQFREKQAFPKLLQLLALDNDVVEYLVGDCVTDDYPLFLISTYDGNIQALFDIVENETLDVFVRTCALRVCEGLYRQGKFSREDFVRCLHRLAAEYAKDEDGIIGANIASIVADCHMADLMRDVWELYDKNCVDLMYLGDYDSFLDELFTYRKDTNEWVKPIENAAELFSKWGCFHQEMSAGTKKNYQNIKRAREKYEQREKRNKVGRNDPCPCGSGKKYKKCCLGKEEQPGDEASKRAAILMKEYPPLSGVPDDQLSFADFFDSCAIEVDIPVYKALHHRAIPVWVERDYAKEQKDNIAFLTEGYRKFLAVCENEKLTAFQQYDEKHQIHYASKNWVSKFASILDEFLENAPLNEACSSLRDEVKQTVLVMSSLKEF